MDFRLAVMQDLQQIKEVYREIIAHMNQNGITIWDDSYPCEFFAEDIAKNGLYILLDKEQLVSAFALCDTSAGEQSVKWGNRYGKALYIDRLGVAVGYAGKGVGSLMLTKAKEVAKQLGAQSLRLFVVDSNTPAIGLYEKNGFQKADGVYHEVIDDSLVLRQYGYEIRIH